MAEYLRVVALSLLLASSANGQQIASRDQAARRAEALADDLVRCRTVTNETERLACFDRTSAALAAARETGDLVLLDREGVKQAKRAVFGFSLPSIKLFGDRGADREEPEVREIDSTLTRVSLAGTGRHLLTLADNTQWQVTEAPASFFPRAGKPIKIKAGILGSYTARIDDGRTVWVKRVR